MTNSTSVEGRDINVKRKKEILWNVELIRDVVAFSASL